MYTLIHTHLYSCTCSSSNQRAITCSSRAASGYLYPLDKGFIFVHKPAVYIKFDAIASVNFARMTGGAGVSKSFDFEVELKDGNVHHFSSMMKYVCLSVCVSIHLSVSVYMYVYVHMSVCTCIQVYV